MIRTEDFWFTVTGEGDVNDLKEKFFQDCCTACSCSRRYSLSGRYPSVEIYDRNLAEELLLSRDVGNLYVQA